jgi:RNA polymerase sigma factor (sigma-70 family)
MKQLHTLAREIERVIGVKEQLVCPQFLKTILGSVTHFGFQSDEALEIVHETLSILLLKVQKQELRCKSSLKAFACGISRNICLKRIKALTRLKRRRDLIPLPIETLEADPRHWNPLEILKRKETEQLIKQCIQMLEEQEYQEVFTLVFEGYRRHEISARLNLPVARIDAILSYGKKKLTQYVQKKTRMKPSPFSG